MKSFFDLRLTAAGALSRSWPAAVFAIAIALVLLPAGNTFAQQAAPASITMLVTDPGGSPVPAVKVAASGPATREGTTTAEGTLRFTNVRAGNYRLRFEAEGFITLEREVTVKVRQPIQLDVMLNPEPQPEPEPEPEAEATPVPAARPDAAEAALTALAAMVSLPDWIEQNFIGRDPSKISVIAETGLLTATVLQLREPLAERLHGDADEMLYVIAGNAAVRIAGIERQVQAGWFAPVPRGAVFSIVPKGRNPFVALSIATRPVE
jgi:mannose-6-phosphate isomerase-like protein (cupin superfamily)